MECGGKRSATPLLPGRFYCSGKRRRRCALPAHSKHSLTIKTLENVKATKFQRVVPSLLRLCLVRLALLCLPLSAQITTNAPSATNQPAVVATGNAPRDEARQQEAWVNSLGMKFVTVSGTKVMFCVWDVRVKDFEAFVNSTGYDATDGMYSLLKGGWKQIGATWKSPGFSQTPMHPVCGVSWLDAQAFCEWLSKREISSGTITGNQSYRLPTDSEWSVAVGLNESTAGTPKEKSGKTPGEYPWGMGWPPPNGAGNYGGSEANDKDWPADRIPIPGYRDDYGRTSPVGSFAPNSHGLYDLGGNVWQWCEDWYDGDRQYRVLRGASWNDCNNQRLLSSFRGRNVPDVRRDFVGFRCVLAGGAPAPK